MTISFERIPATLDELKALPEASLKQPEFGTALFVAAMMNYKDDPATAISMLEFLKGPAGVSEYEKQFIKDRLSDGKEYVVRSYFAGTSPENDYTPSVPYSVTPERDLSFEENGRARIFMKSSGADSPRMIKMRLKASTGEWFIEEELILSDIRIPKNMDPWA
ncbi:MAG: hypothetical protein IKW88_06090 [Clostridiales bacterium]|nr:hypothetical protein [Clostridiales bacterium]